MAIVLLLGETAVHSPHPSATPAKPLTTINEFTSSHDHEYLITEYRCEQMNTEMESKMKNKRVLIAIAAILILHIIGGCDGLHEDEIQTLESRLVSTPEARAAVDGFYTASASSTFVLKPGNISSVTWRYTTTAPASSWNTPSFRATGWSYGSPGFYGLGDALATEDKGRTVWPAGKSDLWLRASFSVSSSDTAKLMFWGRWDDTIEIYINGVLAASEPNWSNGYRYLGFTPDGRAALKGGSTNTIAVHVHDGGGGRYFDLGVTRNQTLTSRPMAGSERTSALAAFGNTVRQYMIEHGIPAGVISVMKNDQVVVNRAIGWTKKDFATAVSANAVLRLASNDKIVTRAAVRSLIDSGAVDPVTQEIITDTTPIFPLLVAHGITAAPGMTPDWRTNQITIGHLLAHQGGLRELPEPAEFYTDLQIDPGTSTMADNVRWVYSEPLQFAPGTDTLYSSSGYMVLRYLVHVVTGDLITYLRNTLLAPVGTTDVFIAAETLESRSPREPWYATLEKPYDRWVYLENYTALSASSEAMVRFLRGYDLETGTRLIDPNTGEWSPDSCTNPSGEYFGGMAGTFSMTAQYCSEQIGIAVIFNINGVYDDTLRLKLENVIASLSESAWGI